MKSTLHADRALALFCGLLALGYLFSAQGISTPQMVDPIGPRIFPLLIGSGLLLSSLLLLLESRARRRRAAGEVLATPSLKLLGGALAWTLAYYLVFEPLGYLVSTFCYLAVLLLVLNRRKPVWDIALAIALSISLYALFDRGLNVQMPQGILPF